MGWSGRGAIIRVSLLPTRSRRKPRTASVWPTIKPKRRPKKPMALPGKCRSYSLVVLSRVGNDGLLTSFGRLRTTCQFRAGQFSGLALFGVFPSGDRCLAGVFPFHQRGRQQELDRAIFDSERNPKKSRAGPRSLRHEISNATIAPPARHFTGASVASMA